MAAPGPSSRRLAPALTRRRPRSRTSQAGPGDPAQEAGPLVPSVPSCLSGTRTGARTFVGTGPGIPGIASKPLELSVPRQAGAGLSHSTDTSRVSPEGARQRGSGERGSGEQELLSDFPGRRSIRAGNGRRCALRTEPAPARGHLPGHRTLHPGAPHGEPPARLPSQKPVCRATLRRRGGKVSSDGRGRALMGDSQARGPREEGVLRRSGPPSRPPPLQAAVCSAGKRGFSRPRPPSGSTQAVPAGGGGAPVTRGDPPSSSRPASSPKWKGSQRASSPSGRCFLARLPDQARR